MLTLWQAEGCPYSHRVRERLTELGVDFVAKQVPADRGAREEMRAATGEDSIPTLVLDDGRAIHGAEAITEHLEATYEERPDAELHRRKYAADAPLREPQHYLGRFS